MSKINTYTCGHGHVTITRDIDEGTTPFHRRCKQQLNEKHACTDWAVSAGYLVDQSLEPEYEWVKPVSAKKYPPSLREHIKKGGLVLRKISKPRAEPV